MKKSGKVLLIIALCCVVLGTTVCCVAVAAVRFSGEGWEYDYNEKMFSKEFDSISAIQLNLINEPVKIIRGGDTVVIEWSQRYDNQYRFSGSEGGRVQLNRNEFSGFGVVWNGFRPSVNISAVESWLRRWGWNDNNDMDGYGLPVTITVPEGIDLSQIEINGVDLQILLDNVEAQTIQVNGVNAQFEFRTDDITQYRFEANGIGSSIRVDGHTVSYVGIGSYSYDPYNASRRVEINGVNAELNVWTR